MGTHSRVIKSEIKYRHKRNLDKLTNREFGVHTHTHTHTHTLRATTVVEQFVQN